MIFNRNSINDESILQVMIRVLQNSQYWLELTQNWLYTQVTHLPADIENHIACFQEENLQQFPYNRLHTFSRTLAGRIITPLVQRGRLTRIRFALYKRWIDSLMKQTHPHILHSHFGPLAWYVKDPARNNRAKHIVTFYGNDVNQVPQQHPHWRAKYLELFKGIDLVLCEGPFMAQSIARLGCDPARIRVHHLGIQLDKVPFQHRIWQPGYPLKILIAASFREKKGIPYALEAINRLNTSIPVEVTIIGDANREPAHQQEKARILQTIHATGLQDRVRLMGYQPYSVLLQAMQDHHIFLSPSVHANDGDTEGGAPVSIIEASASGMMVVSTTHCDIPNVIRHQQSGLLAPERDVESLSAHLHWLIEHPEKWNAFALAGRQHIEANFDAVKQGANLGAIYRSLL